MPTATSLISRAYTPQMDKFSGYSQYPRPLTEKIRFLSGTHASEINLARNGGGKASPGLVNHPEIIKYYDAKIADRKE